MRRFTDYLVCDFLGGPRPWKFAWVINFQKAGTFVFLLALIAYYDAGKREGWDAKRLTPLLAGLDQLLPWIHQWHTEIDPEFGETAGQSFQTMLEADAHELGLTLEDIRAWEPPAKTKTRRKRKTK